MRTRPFLLTAALVFALMLAGCVAEPCATGVAAHVLQNGIGLTWDPTANATVYAIARGVDGGALAAYTVVGGTSFTDTNVTVGHTYTYSVGTPSLQPEVECPTITAALSDARVPFFGPTGILLGVGGSLMGVLMVLLRRR